MSNQVLLLCKCHTSIILWITMLGRLRNIYSCHDVKLPILVPIRTDQQIPADPVDNRLFLEHNSLYGL